MSATRRDRLLPLLVFLALTLAVYAAGAVVPYRADTDTGFQLRSVQQWARGESPSPGVLRLPDPQDLSRDVLLWSNWWPPGFPFLYAPLTASGLPFAAALRLTSMLLFLAGSLGWLRLASRFAPSPGVRLLFAVSLLGYAVTIGGASSLRTADLLAYAAGPWLATLALAVEPRPSKLFPCGLALGTSYWLRYSLFLAALAFLVFLAARVAAPSGASPPGRRMARLAALGLGFALPVVALFLLNLRQSGNLPESVSGTRTAWEADGSGVVRPALLAVSLAGSPGLSLFQNDVWLTHLTQFSDARLPWFRRMGATDRILARSLLGIPATLALLWGLARALRRRPRVEGALVLTSLAIFYLALTALSVLVGYNYLATEARLSAGFFPLASLLALAGWLPRPDRPPGPWERPLAAVLLAFFFAAPLAFAILSFAKNDVCDRPASYTASATGLFLPELSPRNVPEVNAAVAAVLRSPDDAVVLAGPSGWGSAFLLWLESPRRTLPVATFYAPLGARYLDASDLHGAGPLTSSRPLRLVLVVSRNLIADGTLPRLQARFPQARAWQHAPAPAHANVALYFSDLEVP